MVESVKKVSDTAQKQIINFSECNRIERGSETLSQQRAKRRGSLRFSLSHLLGFVRLLACLFTHFSRSFVRIIKLSEAVLRMAPVTLAQAATTKYLTENLRKQIDFECQFSLGEMT